MIEVDGPSHFSVNSRRPLGRTVARKLMIEGRGYIVRSIPYYEWCALDGMETRQTYLWRLLASAVSLGNGQAAAQLEEPACHRAWAAACCPAGAASPQHGLAAPAATVHCLSNTVQPQCTLWRTELWHIFFMIFVLSAWGSFPGIHACMALIGEAF